MNILFINSNLHGHINPTLGLVRELTERGHAVDYFCSEAFTEKVTQAGACRIGFDKHLEDFLSSYRPTDRHPFYMLLEYMLLYDEAVLPDLLSLLSKNQYDMILCDSIFGCSCFLQQLTNLPIVCSHSSFAMSKTPLPDRMLEPGFHPQLDNCYAIVRRICEQYHLTEPSLTEIFISRGERNVVYTTQKFNGNPDVCRPTYLFAGPAINRGQEADAPTLPSRSNRKLIYISLGSFNTDFIDFYRTCIAAFRDTAYDVYMSIGKKCDVDSLGELPENFYVKNYLPQLEILSRADAFVTHAGFNSVNEAMYYGVPMLALPLVNDQHMVAKRLTALHLGITDDLKTITPDGLQSQVEYLLADAQIYDNCKEISQEVQQSANVARTVTDLETYLQTYQYVDRKGRTTNGN